MRSVAWGVALVLAFTVSAHAECPWPNADTSKPADLELFVAGMDHYGCADPNKCPLLKDGTGHHALCCDQSCIDPAIRGLAEVIQDQNGRDSSRLVVATTGDNKRGSGCVFPGETGVPGERLLQLLKEEYRSTALSTVASQEGFRVTYGSAWKVVEQTFIPYPAQYHAEPSGLFRVVLSPASGNLPKVPLYVVRFCPDEAKSCDRSAEVAFLRTLLTSDASQNDPTTAFPLVVGDTNEVVGHCFDGACSQCQDPKPAPCTMCTLSGVVDWLTSVDKKLQCTTGPAAGTKFFTWCSPIMNIMAVVKSTSKKASYDPVTWAYSHDGAGKPTCPDRGICVSQLVHEANGIGFRAHQATLVALPQCGPNQISCINWCTGEAACVPGSQCPKRPAVCPPPRR